MSRPELEVADIFRDHGAAWRRANAGHVSLDQMKVMSAIERCRTAALGGHVARCENEKCAHTIIAYNSCLMGKSSNGELAWRRSHFPVDRRAFALHNMTPLSPRRCGHCWPVTNGNEHVGDLLPGIENAGTFTQRAERALPRWLRSGAQATGL